MPTTIVCFLVRFIIFIFKSRYSLLQNRHVVRVKYCSGNFADYCVDRHTYYVRDDGIRQR